MWNPIDFISTVLYKVLDYIFFFYMHSLEALLLYPFIAIPIIFILGVLKDESKNEFVRGTTKKSPWAVQKDFYKSYKTTITALTVPPLVLNVFLFCLFIKNSSEQQISFVLDLAPVFNYPLHFGVDGLTIFLLLLTNFYIFLSIHNSDNTISRFHLYVINILLIQSMVNLAFTVLDLGGFFIFFEGSLIPIFFLVLIWGSRSRKVRANYLIAIYTLFGSIFMFINILYILAKTGSTNYEYLMTIDFTIIEQKFLWLTFFLAFATKVPLFPLHIWLPEAHVEAPTVGSVLLAVVILKLGTYGIIRFCIPLFPYATVYYTPLVYTFAVCGIIYTCFTAIRQIDLKKIIAYSSVGHMNVVLIGIMSLRIEALEGALFQMISHGIVSGALFFCVGVVYDRYHVRSLKYFGGLTNVYPMFAIVFLIFSLANISFPGTSSFIGEFLILAGVYKESSLVVFFASFSMVLGAVYTLWTYNRIFFGNLKNLSIKSSMDLTRREAYTFLTIIIALFIMGLYSKSILDCIHVSCVTIIEHTKQQLI